MAKIIHHHLGLGDHIVCYGLVRHIAANQAVYLFTKEHNIPTVSAMYAGCNVHIISVQDDQHAAQWETHPDYVRYGFKNENEDVFGAEFYKQAGVPYEYRWKYYPERDMVREQAFYDSFGQQDVFIHDDAQRGYVINKEGFRANIYYTPNILDYGMLIENAKEVHCIESSFRLFIDFLNPKGVLYLHFNNEKSFRIVPTKHIWKVY